MFDSNDMKLFSMSFIEELNKLFDGIDHQKIAEATREIIRTRDNGKSIFVVGSGQSSSLANHFASSLLLKSDSKKKPFKTYSLNASSTSISIVAENDHIDQLYSKQLLSLANRGDLLVVFSETGNCQSIVEAIKVAKTKECTIVGISSMGGGLLKSISDICLYTSKSDICNASFAIQMNFIQIITSYIQEFCQIESRGVHTSHPNQLNLLEIQ
ncbi:SIS domain-containing protein [Halobacteriovorax sp. HLS]|uniref:SIS domain-containing protein n=1 Tax=Halobacteriovorax sp. HLS TaxID=2234000 RepID=UPI000FDB4EAB|nr:SIS domain-containing protein [Halobacteriovorax sp. HLS]